jgi:preprotein translocase subunit YajC
MNTLFLGLLQNEPAQAPAQGFGGMLGSIVPLLLIVAVFYFLILRPQNKKQKQTEKMLAALSKGDKVVTIGGIRGVIQSVRDDTVVIKVDDNTKIEFNRSAVATVLGDIRPEDKKVEKTDSASESETTKK